MERWPSLLKPLLNLFLESPCPLCQRSTGDDFCRACQRQVQQCQLLNPQQCWSDSLPLFVWGDYSGALRRAIAVFKYENQPQLARPLGHWLAHSWLTHAPTAAKRPLVVPIPMHPAKQKKRGYNQAELLAATFCDITRLPLNRQGLKRVRSTEAQFTLSNTNRDQNLKGAFQVEKELFRANPSTPVLLVDDIYTTGATARAAVQTLRDCHIDVLGMVAIAKPSFYK
jgi:ComF family protein